MSPNGNERTTFKRAMAVTPTLSPRSERERGPELRTCDAVQTTCHLKEPHEPVNPCSRSLSRSSAAGAASGWFGVCEVGEPCELVGREVGVSEKSSRAWRPDRRGGCRRLPGVGCRKGIWSPEEHRAVVPSSRRRDASRDGENLRHTSRRRSDGTTVAPHDSEAPCDFVAPHDFERMPCSFPASVLHGDG